MTDPRVQEMMDREAIRDCIYRYCRGIDRADEATLRGSYWPDAHDSHGPYAGPVDGFVEWAKKVWATEPRNVHHVNNILIEFDGTERALVESYFLALQRGAGADGKVRQFLLSGRYCDRFEKRGEEWRVTDRLVVYDWVDEQTPPTASEAERFGPRTPIGANYPDDAIYSLLKGSPR